VENIRMRCRTHNQLEAERVFGSGFMQEKREAPRRAAESRRSGPSRISKEGRATDEARVEVSDEDGHARAKAAQESAATHEHTRDILAGLRELGVRGDLARRAAEIAASLCDATLEERMKAALRALGPRPRSHPVNMNVSPSP
jgi:hypothetical protein